MIVRRLRLPHPGTTATTSREVRPPMAAAVLGPVAVSRERDHRGLCRRGRHGPNRRRVSGRQYRTPTPRVGRGRGRAPPVRPAPHGAGAHVPAAHHAHLATVTRGISGVNEGFLPALRAEPDAAVACSRRAKACWLSMRRRSGTVRRARRPRRPGPRGEWRGSRRPSVWVGRY
jgi:hypothetical protein